MALGLAHWSALVTGVSLKCGAQGVMLEATGAWAEGSLSGGPANLVASGCLPGEVTLVTAVPPHCHGD